MQMTRETLYQAVWEKPMTVLAKEFGISDVGLSKVCRKNNIPIPGRGYWAKAAVMGAEPPPRLEGDGRLMLAFNGEPSLKKSSIPIATSNAIKTALEGGSEYSSTRLAPLTKKTADALNKKPDQYGFLIAYKGCFKARVSPQQRERTIFILDTLERTLKSLGATFINNGETAIVVMIDGQSIGFEISEKTKRREHIEVHPTHEFLNSKTYSYEFLGELTVKLDGWLDGRKSWSDGKQYMLETKLQEVIEGFIHAADGLKSKEVTRQAEREAREVRQKQMMRDQLIEREQQQFIHSILEETEAWRRAKEIREYADLVRATMISDGCQLSVAEEHSLQQMYSVADLLDPLYKRIKTILNEEAS